jgi:hypothetical protein
MSLRHCEERSDEAIQFFRSPLDCFASLAMTIKLAFPAHTFSNGNSILLRFSSHSGTGRFFERMKAGLNSFD